MSSSVTERFLRYVAIDTQSDPSSSAQPSTEKQKNLSRLLVEELLEIGIADAHIESRYGAEGQGPSIYLSDPEGNALELKGPPWPPLRTD